MHKTKQERINIAAGGLKILDFQGDLGHCLVPRSGSKLWSVNKQKTFKNMNAILYRQEFGYLSVAKLCHFAVLCDRLLRF